MENGIDVCVRTRVLALFACVACVVALSFAFASIPPLSAMAASRTAQVSVQTATSATQTSVRVGSERFTLKLAENDTAAAFRAYLAKARTLKMKELNGNEKYRYLSKSLPAAPKRFKRVKAGDVMLYGDSCLVIFYKAHKTSYDYTKIGRLTSAKGLAKTLAKAVGKKSVKVRFAKMKQIEKVTNVTPPVEGEPTGDGAADDGGAADGAADDSPAASNSGAADENAAGSGGTADGGAASDGNDDSKAADGGAAVDSGETDAAPSAGSGADAGTTPSAGTENGATSSAGSGTDAETKASAGSGANTDAAPSAGSGVGDSRGERGLSLVVNGEAVEVAWKDNESVAALEELAENGPLVIQTSRYGGFEQVGSIGSPLPKNDTQTTTSPGDIVLYQGNQMVLFYGSNSWSYTRLGKIVGKSDAELATLLGGDGAEVELSTR